MVSFSRGKIFRNISNSRYFPVVIPLMIAFGGWLNAQGAWVKDYGIFRSVNLPLLFVTFHSSGFSWYFVGLIDDLSGLFLGLAGAHLLGRIIRNRPVVGKRYYIATTSLYLVFDAICVYSFTMYYSGSLSLVIYGYIWNDLEYFVMLPLMFLSFALAFLHGSDDRTTAG